MIGTRLVEAVLQVDSSVGMVLFFGGLFLLAGVFYYFTKYVK